MSGTRVMSGRFSESNASNEPSSIVKVSSRARTERLVRLASLESAEEAPDLFHGSSAEGDISSHGDYQAFPGLSVSPMSAEGAEAAVGILKREHVSRRRGKRSSRTSKNLISAVADEEHIQTLEIEVATDEPWKAIRTETQHDFAVPDSVLSDDISKSTRAIRDFLARYPKSKDEALMLLTEKVYQRMEAELENRALQECALTVLGRLAKDFSAASRHIGQTQGVRHIIDSMIEHKSVERIQEKGLCALLYLSDSEKGRAAMVEAKGAESVCWAMKEFLNVRTIQIQGATALCNMAFGSAEHKKRIGKIGGVDSVVRAMDAHADDAELQARCCLALRNLTCGIRMNQWIAGKACSIEAVASALHKFADDINVQYQGCVALANLCADEPDNCRRASESGVIEATIQALKQNKDHPSLPEHGLALLRNLSIDNEENQLLIGEQDGVATILACMDENISRLDVLEKGCSALRYLMFERQNRSAIFECGGLEVLVRILRQAIKSESVGEASIYAMGNSIYDVPESKSAVAKFGGIAAVVSLMSQHLHNSVVQEQGSRALRNLADSDDLTVRILAESGAIDCCIFAMMGYPENSSIQEQASAMLFNMAFSETNIRRMCGLDLERVLEQAREAHGGSPAVLSHVEALLGRLQLCADKFEPRKPASRGNALQHRRSSIATGLGSFGRKMSIKHDKKSRRADIQEPSSAGSVGRMVERVRSFDRLKKLTSGSSDQSSSGP